MPKFLLLAIFAGFVLPCTPAQSTLTAGSELGSSACHGTPLEGSVRDTMQALIPGATLLLDTQNGTAETSIAAGPDGHFRFPCITAGKHQLTASASGFATTIVAFTAPHTARFILTLAPAEVQTQLDVSEDSAVPANSPTASGPSQTISGDRLQALADDPDDLLKQLQMMASAAGGSSSSTTFAVDGFESSDSGVHLPPKSSIAYIKVNPDLFSAEYRDPPISGGRIEIYTKPGKSSFHGALFTGLSPAWLNAHDPFAVTGESISKQRYGFELTGPIRKHGSDFTTTLEHRSIDNVAVVNAITVNSAGVQTPLVQNVPIPQRLWVATQRVDWQFSPRNTFIASINTNVNHQVNVGVGATSLAETGYDSFQYDNNLHITFVTTLTPRIMHEHLLGIDWNGENDTPNSSAPQVSVAGAFTSGGSTVGNAHQREMDLEDVDDAILNIGHHLIKVGEQTSILSEHKRLTTNFNGTYTFGGLVTSTGATVTGIQQYVNALNGAPNGSPTAFANVVGNPEVDFVQLRFAIYYQDDWTARPNLHIAYGARFYTQSDPDVTTWIDPRIGLSWAPGKKSTWNLHAHAGMFAARLRTLWWQEILRMDGTQRVTSTVYAPACAGIFNPATCTPLSTATIIHSERSVAPNLSNTEYGMENIGFTKAFPHKWNLSADYYILQMWHFAHTQNINSPSNGQPTGPRPLAANLNILQLQGSGRGYGNIQYLGLNNQSYKRVQFTAGATRVDITDDTENNPFTTPQTTGVNAGEYARRAGNPLWTVFANATLNLPSKLVFSTNLNVLDAAVYNITTGFDNNGDGDFNDRPQYAPAGTPLCSANPNASPCGYSTPWGELVSSGGIGSLPRNKGQLGWNVYLDTNLQRAFKLTKNAKAEHQQVLTANIRASNVLNHLNITSVGGVLGSPLFGVPYQADNGRRLEAGLRYSF